MKPAPLIEETDWDCMRVCGGGEGSGGMDWLEMGMGEEEEAVAAGGNGEEERMVVGEGDMDRESLFSSRYCDNTQIHIKHISYSNATQSNPIKRNLGRRLVDNRTESRIQCCAFLCRRIPIDSKHLKLHKQ